MGQRNESEAEGQLATGLDGACMGWSRADSLELFGGWWREAARVVCPSESTGRTSACDGTDGCASPCPVSKDTELDAYNLVWAEVTLPPGQTKLSFCVADHAEADFNGG